MNMIVPLVGTSGVDALLGVWKPAGFDFQSLEEDAQLWWLSLPCSKVIEVFIPCKKKSSHWGIFFLFFFQLFW
jgi:hypothetical protein